MYFNQDNFKFMRNFILLLITITLTLSVNAQQVPKKPLIEHFTQASCGPCAGQNPGMYATLNRFGASKYVKITYQVSWPGIDPMNAEYPAGPTARRIAKNVQGVPDAFLNGTSTSDLTTTISDSTLNATTTQMSNLKITASHAYGAGRNIDVKITVKNVGTDTIPAGKKLISAMTEKEINFTTAPGSNGEKDFFYVVRNMYNASTGAADPAGLSLPEMRSGDSLTYTFTTTAPSYIRTYDRIGFAVFVENGVGGAVMQSEYSTPITIAAPLDVSTSNATFNGTTNDYCDNTLIPSFTVKNEKATPITSVKANYKINSGTPVPITVTGLNLAQGQSTTITFPSITLPRGAHSITYSITGLNGNMPDYSATNNTGLSSDRTVMSTTSVANNIMTSFEALAIGTLNPPNAVAKNPDTLRAYVVNNTLSTTLNWKLGGFGNSNNSFRWDFYAIRSGGSSQLIYEKINMTTAQADTAWLKWSTAYAQYSSENDRLEVLVSTDCGANWTSLYNKAGANLSTRSPVGNQTRFYPRTTEWRADSVSLTPYINSTELMIAFKGTSDFGNSLFIDDIQTVFVNGININAIESPTTTFSVFPNPVKNTLNLTFEVANATDLNISIKDALGQTVQQVAHQSFLGETTLTINTSKLAAGVYFINAINDNRVVTKRFVVER